MNNFFGSDSRRQHMIREDGRELVFAVRLKKDIDQPLGSLANAASVGANTVNGPAPFSASARPAASRAVARVSNEPAETAVSRISS